MRWLRGRGGVIFAAALALLGVPVPAAPAPLEREIKATFLYKFAPFVTWPETAFAGPNAPFVICVLGDEGFADSLRAATAGQHEGSRAISVRTVGNASEECQILYVPGQNTAAAIASIKGRPVLTVTDIPLDSAGHGIIGFVMDHGHVRFDIDDAAAAERGLLVSSKLLALAHAVKAREAAP